MDDKKLEYMLALYILVRMLLGYCDSFDLLDKIVESQGFKCIDVCGLAHWVKNW